MAAVSVVTDERGNRHLKVNNRFRMGSTANPANERRLGHIPLLLHPNPHSALFLGLGTGSTVAAAVDHPALQIEAVELLPEVVAVQHYFEGVTGQLSSFGALTIYTSDARRFVRATRRKHDVIVADLFHPARDGSGTLYTREHFLAVRERLAQGGLFCQWLPLYQLDEYCMRMIVRTFLEVFPQANGYLSNLDVNAPILGLVGSVSTPSYPADWFDRRLKNRRLRREVQKAGLTNELTLFGMLVASPQRLWRLAAGAPINTDNYPRVTFAAPNFIYGRQPAGFVNLQHLLDCEEPAATARITLDHAFRTRVSDYMAARDIFLHAQIDRTLGNRSQALEGYVVATEASPDFDLAYTMVLMEANSLVASGARATAIGWLERIIEAHPSRADGKALLRQLKGQRER